VTATDPAGGGAAAAPSLGTRPPSGPGPLGSAMAREIAEQPAVLAALVARSAEIVTAVEGAQPADLRGLVLVARGSSDNAAVYGRYALEHATRRPVALAAPSLHTRYGVHTRLPGFLAIAVSQSGRTPEIVHTLERLAAGGARTVAMTNDPSSPLATGADATVLLGAGEETAVPATKTFTAELAAFALLAAGLGEASWDAGDWSVALDAVEATIADDEPARAAAERIGAGTRLVQVGRGFLYAVALEAGLKIAETTGAPATGYSPADLQHGPIAVAGRDLHALCFAAPGPTAADVAEVAGHLIARGATVTGVAEGPGLIPAAGALLPVPAGVVEPLAPLVHAVRAQQLALHLARAAGLDPDHPPGLNKITPTL
jgi:glucosamine--fructose-6-phosphate aminotransferase (isomerizing)